MDNARISQPKGNLNAALIAAAKVSLDDTLDCWPMQSSAPAKELGLSTLSLWSDLKNGAIPRVESHQEASRVPRYRLVFASCIKCIPDALNRLSCPRPGRVPFSRQAPLAPSL